MAPLMPCRLNRRDLLRFVTGRSGCFRRLYGTGPGAAQRRLHTMDAAQPAAQAVAISGARFLAAASNPDILRLATVRTRKMDLGGETVVPGFVDPTPIRPPPVLRHLREVDCDLRSIAAIVEAIRQRAAPRRVGSRL
jgi:predicted amidohydrolase YtcJ